MAAGMEPNKTSPKDAQVMASILKEMGVNEYEPRVINQLLDFSYRYIADVLEDARICSLHASKKQIDLDDVKLAIERKLDHSFTSPPPREFLLEVARAKNSQPLPLIQDKSGLRLPPDRYCLTGCNYRLKTGPSSQKKVYSSRLMEEKAHSSHQRITVAVPKVQSSSPNIALSVKQGIPLLKDTASHGNRQVPFSSNKLSNQTFQVEHRSMEPTIQTTPKEKTTTEITQEPASKSSTVASLPSMEETAASAHNQRFPNLLKRKREGEEDDYDAT